MLKTLIKRLLGNPNYKRDINLPDEKKGKTVRKIGGGYTKGGEKDDARWLEFDRRKSEQAIENLQRLHEHVRRFAGKK